MQRAEESIRVAAPIDQVYQFWRNFENFPLFMSNIEEVRLLSPDGMMSHWKVKGPLGVTGEFDAELTMDQPGKQIGWNSSGGNMRSTGAVTFSDTGDHTEIHVVMQWFDVPGGPIGEAASRTLQNPDQMLEDDLRKFKDLIEAGGVGLTGDTTAGLSSTGV